MGGSFSHEYHVEDSAGEDTLFSCDHCSYASNQECATSMARAEDRIMSVDGARVHLYTNGAVVHAAVLPSWASVNLSVAPFSQCQPYDDPRSMPLHVWIDSDCSDVPTQDLVDLAQQTVAESSGCDKAAVPLPSAVETRSIRLARRGDTCPSCGVGHLREHRAVEVGHTFLLGTKYSSALGYGVVPKSSPSQKKEPLQMGCYGIGITRILGVLAQVSMRIFRTLHAESGEQARSRVGFAWPSTLAPFSALVLPASAKQMDAALELCSHLATGWAPWLDNPSVIQVPMDDIALDDRLGQSLGARLFDADLLGYPYVFVLGKHFDRTGQVEIRRVGQAVQYAAGP